MTQEEHNEKANKLLMDNGYDGAVYLTDFAYETAIIGISSDNRVIYDYNKMVEYLIDNENMSVEEAEDWISYNTIGACVYDDSPIIMFPIY